MKRIIVILIGMVVLSGVLLGQGRHGRLGADFSYDIRKPPPLPLSEAYTRALGHLGEMTNLFYCVSASCLELTNGTTAGWTFCFANTNGQRGRVNVYYDLLGRELGLAGRVDTMNRLGEIDLKFDPAKVRWGPRISFGGTNASVATNAVPR
jgi:hypothetical protein